MSWDGTQKGVIPKLFFIPFILLLGVISSACSDRVFGTETEQVPGGDAQRGRLALQEYGCGYCHIIPGVPEADGTIGMPLDDWGDRRFIAGALDNDPVNLVAWIMDPESISPGTAMPDLGVTEQDARDMSQYLNTLRRVDSLTRPLVSIRRGFSDLFVRAEVDEPPVRPAQIVTAEPARGWEIYSRYCAECHRYEGEGLRGSVPALKENQFVTAGDPAQAIQVVLHGQGAMPGFAGRLSDAQIAAVVTYIRIVWGNNASGVSVEQVQSER